MRLTARSLKIEQQTNKYKLDSDEKSELLNKVCARKSVKDFEKTRTQR